MKKIILPLVFFLCGLQLLAQENYEYVKVPVKFEEFEENEYQLNALTAFLFEKYGLKPIYNKTAPAGTDPCEILEADVHNNSGLFTSTLYFTLKDCNGQIIFTSEKGKSGEKDYKSSYHEALREAFSSVSNWNFPRSSQKQTAANSEENVVTEVEEKRSLPEKNRQFINGTNIFTLQGEPSKFELYRKGETEIYASLLKSGSGLNYIYASESIQGNAYFDEDGNLIVEYLDPASGLLTKIVYQKINQ